LTLGPSVTAKVWAVGNKITTNVSSWADDSLVYKSTDCSGEAAGYVLLNSTDTSDYEATGLVIYSSKAHKIIDRNFVLSKSNWSLSEVNSYKNATGCQTNARPTWTRNSTTNAYDTYFFRYLIFSLREVQLPSIQMVDAYNVETN
jgi:hypothetical protein